MEVDTENVGMDETDALMSPDDDVVVNNNDKDNDEAPTVEETYEITTTRRKTIRTSYKIQEVSRSTTYIQDDHCRRRNVGVSCRMIVRGGSRGAMSSMRSKINVQDKKLINGKEEWQLSLEHEFPAAIRA